MTTAIHGSGVVSPSGDPLSRAVETPRRSRRIVSMVTFVALVASLALNVLLAHKVRSLTNAQSARIADRLLTVGAVVPPITVTRLGGQQEVVSYQGSNEATVLYIFTPSCVWCARNLDNFKTLLNQKSSQYRVIGLSLSDEGLPEYVANNGLNLPIYFSLSKETKDAYKLSGTPQTIVISPEGKVLQDWAGAYVGDQKTQVEAFFHVSLPGLKELPKAEAATR